MFSSTFQTSFYFSRTCQDSLVYSSTFQARADPEVLQKFDLDFYSHIYIEKSDIENLKSCFFIS